MTKFLRLFALTAVVLLASLAISARAAQLPEFREIAQKASPAVVKIVVEQRATPTANNNPDMEQVPEYLRRFFDVPGNPQKPYPRRGSGSGFIISHDGYIVTNNHVVEGADSVLVRVIDRREFEAEVIGTDARSDLALLRIEAKNLPVLDLGASGDLDVGEWVLAIGSPFGLDYSVTQGIVSGKGRSLPTERGENYVPFIQTDVAINPGNSGGPLLNLEGEVVGVNSQIFTRSGGSIGLSFAIPVSVVENVVGQLKKNGRVTRGWLGVSIQDVDKNLAESFGLERPQGALISMVSANSPAEKGGLEAGDVIITFDGKEIPTSSDLPHVVGLIEPGTKVSVELMRQRERKTLKVEVGGLDSGDGFSLTPSSPENEAGGRIGVVVDDVPAKILEQSGISGGVIVRQVSPGSAAAVAGIRSGDIVTLIGNAPTSSVGAFQRAEKRLQAGRSVPMRLIRRGSPLFIGLKLDD